MKFKATQNLGWMAALMLVGLMIGAGFQGGAEKTAVVDMNKVITESNLGKKNVADLETMFKSRQTLLSFVDDKRVLTGEQAKRLKELTLKGTLTPAETAEEKKIKDDIDAAAKNFNALNQKANPTEDDRRLLSEYNQRFNDTVRQLQAWQEEFTADINRRQAELRQLEIAKAKEALQEVAKKAAFTVVLENQIAPFGANDLTADVTKAMNAKP